mmetsp:Transcript_2454/g.3390  ORF Transcript_2454/g.3390 Transcript_2454/m.3390 type:complete len:83 (+) Transcript_2454:199-447(+)
MRCGGVVRGGTSIVTLLCDDGRRYENTYYCDKWLCEHGLDIDPYLEQITEFWETGRLPKTSKKASQLLCRSSIQSHPPNSGL